MHPVLCKIASHTIWSYSFMIILALVLIILLFIARESKSMGIKAYQVINLFTVMFLGGFLISGLMSIGLNFQDFIKSPSALILKPGFSFHGGVLGGFLAASIYLKINKLFSWKFMDALFTYCPLGHVFGRIGCFLAGCCYGAPSGLPWAIKFTNIPFRRHPTQLYEAFGEFVIFLILLKFRRRRSFDGQIMLMYLMLYSTLRFFVEIFRKGSTASVVFFGLTQAQIFSLFVILLSGYFMIKKLQEDFKVNFEETRQSV